jgi:hypothetical protein
MEAAGYGVVCFERSGIPPGALTIIKADMLHFVLWARLHGLPEETAIFSRSNMDQCHAWVRERGGEQAAATLLVSLAVWRDLLLSDGLLTRPKALAAAANGGV